MDSSNAPAQGRKTGPISYIRIRVRPPCVMMIRLEPGEEPEELELGDLFVRVIRVRQPLPACHRMQITRPLVVIVGESVRDADRAMIMDRASEIGAAVLPLGPLVRRQALGKWVRDAIQIVAKRRTERGDDVEQVAAG
jgi:hypothetical protein